MKVHIMARKRSTVSMFWGSPEPTHYDDGTIASVGRARDIRSGRPVHHTERRYAIPRNPISYITLYQTMFLCLPWRFSINVKIQEKYRRGIEVVPRFSSKCKKCGVEYTDLAPKQTCPECAGELRSPDRTEKRIMEKEMENINLNHESLEDVMQQTHVDICVADEGYVILRKEYFAEDNEVKWSKTKEIIWGSPIVMRPVVDPHTGTPGGMFWVCPQCRKKAKVHLQRQLPDSPAYDIEASALKDSEVYEEAPHCEKCGLKMMDVKYVSVFHERGYIENYYVEGEVIHWHEYMKSHTFSVPPGITLWVPSTIIIYKDTWIRDSYRKQRKPRGAIIAVTGNPEGFWNKWEKVMERVKKDWHYSPMIPMEPEAGITGGSGKVEWVDFMGDMKDLEYEKVRKIYERNILQWYGVGNIFANIEDGSSGKGSSEAKLIISNRHREWSNRNDNRVLRIISDELGYRDHIYKIMQPEDRDEMKKEEIFTKRSNNAQLVESLGYEAKLDEINHKFDFRYDSQKELNKALNIINQLLQIKLTGSAPPMEGGDGDDEQQGSETVTPKVDSAEFSGTATEGDMGIDKASDGDVRMHEGDTKPTPASGHVTNQQSKPRDGYYAPDGTGPFKSKQALGGYMRTKDDQHGQGAGPGGAGAGAPGQGGPGDGMAPTASKEDYKKALGLIRDRELVEVEILDMIEDMVDCMPDEPEVGPDGNGSEPESPDRED
jgi:hypothetical protein